MDSRRFKEVKMTTGHIKCFEVIPCNKRYANKAKAMEKMLNQPRIVKIYTKELKAALEKWLDILLYGREGE